MVTVYIEWYWPNYQNGQYWQNQVSVEVFDDRTLV